MKELKQHTIIERPWEFRIVKFEYNSQSDEPDEHHIELWLQKGSQLKKLKFSFPTQLKIEEGFPAPTSGMIIFDVSNLQMENINVQVSDFESSWGTVSFYAKSVEEIV